MSVALERRVDVAAAVWPHADPNRDGDMFAVGCIVIALKRRDEQVAALLDEIPEGIYEQPAEMAKRIGDIVRALRGSP